MNDDDMHEDGRPRWKGQQAQGPHPRPKTYDTKCYELAEHFLQDEPHLDTEKRRDALASLIQATIEPWIESELDNYEPPSPPGWEGGFADNH